MRFGIKTPRGREGLGGRRRSVPKEMLSIGVRGGAVDAVQVAASKSAGSVVRDDGTVWHWGDAPDTLRYYAEQVPGLSDVVQVAAGNGHHLARKSDGTVWAWGYNSWGGLGTGDYTNHTTPQQVALPDSATFVAAGHQCSFAVLADGRCFAWGSNLNGKLGISSNESVTDATGVPDHSTTPMQVVFPDTNFPVTRVACGSEHTLFLRGNGGVYHTGANDSEQAGLGAATVGEDRFRCTQVGIMNNDPLTGAQDIAAGELHSFALMPDGTTWAWGSNGNGALGLGVDGGVYSTRQSIPNFSVVELTAHTYGGAARKSDGSVWVWGGGGAGNGSLTPIQHPDIPSASKLSQNGWGEAVLFVAPDCGLWGWGNEWCLGAGDLGEPGFITFPYTPVETKIDASTALDGCFGQTQTTSAGCEQAEFLSGSGDQETTAEIKKNSIKITIDNTISGASPSLTLSVYKWTTGGELVRTITKNDGGQATYNIDQGGARYRFVVESTDITYKITIEDCIAAEKNQLPGVEPPPTDTPANNGTFPTGPGLFPTPNVNMPALPEDQLPMPGVPAAPVIPGMPPGFGAGDIGKLEVPEFDFDPCMDFGEMPEFDPCAGGKGSGAGKGGTGGKPGSGSGFTPSPWPDPGTIDIVIDPPYQTESTFASKRCYTNASARKALEDLCAEVGLDPSKVTFEDERDKKFTKCFAKGSKKFDAIWWLADYLGYEAFDPGDYSMEFSPPTPLPIFWIHNEFIDLVEFSRNYDAFDVYYAVEVFRPESVRGGTIAVPEFSHFEIVNTAFDVDPENILRIEALPTWSDQDCIDHAKSQAAMMKTGLGVTVATPLNMDARFRHQIIVQRPSKNFAMRVMIGKTVHSLSENGNLSVYEASYKGIVGRIAHQWGVMSTVNGQPYYLGGKPQPSQPKAFPSKMGVARKV